MRDGEKAGTRARRTGALPAGVVLLAVLLLWSAGCVRATEPGPNGGSLPAASMATSSGVGKAERIYQPAIDYSADFIFSREDATQAADVIVVGKIVKVEPSRWNTADGSEGAAAPAGAQKVVYTIYYLEPERYLFGSSVFGKPVPFQRVGGVVDASSSILRYYPDYDPGVGVGDTVLVYLVEKGPDVAGPGEPPAYWLYGGWLEIFRGESDGTFVRRVPAGAEAMRVTLAQAEKEIAGWKQLGTSSPEALAGVVARLEDRGIRVRENRLAGFVAELTIESAGSGGAGTPDDPVNVVWVRHELTVAKAEGMAVEEAAITVVDAGDRTLHATRQPLSVPYPGSMDDPAVNADVARNLVRDEIGRLGLATGMDLDAVTVTDGGAGGRFLMIRLSAPDLATANRVIPGFMRGLQDVLSAADTAGAGIHMYQVDVADFDGPLYLRFIDDWLVPSGASWWLAPGVTSEWLGP